MVKLEELKLGPDHPETLRTRQNLAEAYVTAGRIFDGIALNEATLHAARPHSARIIRRRWTAGSLSPRPTMQLAAAPPRRIFTVPRSSTFARPLALRTNFLRRTSHSWVGT